MFRHGASASIASRRQVPFCASSPRNQGVCKTVACGMWEFLWTVRNQRTPRCERTYYARTGFSASVAIRFTAARSDSSCPSGTIDVSAIVSAAHLWSTVRRSRHDFAIGVASSIDRAGSWPGCVARPCLFRMLKAKHRVDMKGASIEPPILRDESPGHFQRNNQHDIPVD